MADAGLSSTLPGSIPPSSSRRKIAALIGFGLILTLAACLRGYRLGERSLWLDEAVVANGSRGSARETLTHTRMENSAPIAHPAILNLTERISDSPWAVRIPSFAASVLAVAVLLALSNRVGWLAAAFAALLLTVSASEIRYAQEVREYSLSVLYAALLLYAFLQYTMSKPDTVSSRWRKPLNGLLFGAPLVQYGLLLLGAAVLASTGILWLLKRPAKIRFSQMLFASACLGAGASLSFFLTLRYQWSVASSWYLQANYLQSVWQLPRFIPVQSAHLVAFILPVYPSLAALACTLVVVFLCMGKLLFIPKYLPLFTLTAMSFCAVLTAALLRLYPYGGVRQCLFLAPILAMAVGTSLSDFVHSFRGLRTRLATAAIVFLILFCGAFQIQHADPYAEIENIQSVLRDLRVSIRGGDLVYVYYGAVPAVDYYWKRQPASVVHGSQCRNNTQGCNEEIARFVLPGTKRLWLVFSHDFRQDEQAIVRDLGGEWTVQRMVSAQGASLYLAQRNRT